MTQLCNNFHINDHVRKLMYVIFRHDMKYPNKSLLDLEGGHTFLQCKLPEWMPPFLEFVNWLLVDMIFTALKRPDFAVLNHPNRPS